MGKCGMKTAKSGLIHWGSRTEHVLQISTMRLMSFWDVYTSGYLLIFCLDAATHCSYAWLDALKSLTSTNGETKCFPLLDEVLPNVLDSSSCIIYFAVTIPLDYLFYQSLCPSDCCLILLKSIVFTLCHWGKCSFRGICLSTLCCGGSLSW